MNKVIVPDNAIDLWKQVLIAPVTVPEWECARSVDVQNLLCSGLVMVDRTGFPQRLVRLVDSEMSLTSQDQRLMALIAEFGDSRDKVISEAKASGIKRPLEVLKRLAQLDVLRYGQEEGGIRFRIR